MGKILTNIIRIISIIIIIFISYLISKAIKSSKAINTTLEQGLEIIKKYTKLEEVDIGEYKKITIKKYFLFIQLHIIYKMWDILQYYRVILDSSKYLVFI